jgi:hypothetical protein
MRRVLLKMSDNLATEEAAYIKATGARVLPMGALIP